VRIVRRMKFSFARVFLTLLALPVSVFSASNSVVNLSHYDPMRVDFNAMTNAGIVGVIHEASYPSYVVDDKYAGRQAAAVRAGLLWGAYHFANASDPVRQADFFLNTVEKTWRRSGPESRPDEILLVLDFEKNGEASMQYLQHADYIFCLDFNVLHRTKHMENYIQAAKAQTVLIDHHEQPQIAFFTYGVSNTSKSSTCEMVYDFIMASGHADKISLDVAQCLYTGLMTDTGSFRFTATTASVHRMVAHLKELGLEHTPIHDLIYDNYHENRLRFLGFILLNRLEVFYEYNTALIAVSRADLLRFHIQTGDTEGIVNYPLSIQGIRMAALVIDREEERKWSFRSKGNVDVNTFARTYFNGGGHFSAAGGKSNESLKDTVTFFKKVIEQEKERLQIKTNEHP
jgi:phosphoesterase RecJ-like protein